MHHIICRANGRYLRIKTTTAVYKIAHVRHTSYIPSIHRNTDKGCPGMVCFQMTNESGDGNTVINKLYTDECGGPATYQIPPPVPYTGAVSVLQALKDLSAFWPIILLVGVAIFGATWKFLPVGGGIKMNDPDRHMPPKMD